MQIRKKTPRKWEKDKGKEKGKGDKWKRTSEKLQGKDTKEIGKGQGTKLRRSKRQNMGEWDKEQEITNTGEWGRRNDDRDKRQGIWVWDKRQKTEFGKMEKEQLEKGK